MSATTPRTIANAPDLRQLLVAVGALILAVALLVAVTISRQATFDGASAPAAVPASVAHDRGWSSASGLDAGSLVVNGSTGFVIPSQAAGSPVVNGSTGFVIPAEGGSTGLVIRTQNGAIVYVGIPYTAPVAETPAYNGYPSLGRELIVRTESGGLRYTGIPYPAPASEFQGGSNGMHRAQ